MTRELVIPPPNEKQWIFLNESEHKYVAYGGARGGGKSWAVRVKAVLLCLKYAGIKVMIVRKTYPELSENHILPLCEMLRVGAADALATYNDSKKNIVFHNGSRILFRFCDTERDTLKFQGTEVDVLFVDEATQQSEENIDKLKACVRGVNEFPKRIYFTCNPGGEGHAWVKRLFVDRDFKKDERPEEYLPLIRAGVRDNTVLMETDPDYLHQLEALPPKLRRAWLNGDWDIYEGQFFEDFRIEPDVQTAHEHGCMLTADELREQHRWCHVIEPFDIGSGECRGWNILRSYDFGYGKPFSCAWWAVDYDGVLYRIMEFYGCTSEPNVGVRMTPDEQFKKIAEIENTHPWLKGRRIDGVADPAIWDVSRGESIAETAMHYGLYFTQGDNKRIPGWMQCHYRLQFDDNGYSRMYVFANCKAFIRTVPLMAYSSRHPEDLDTELEDHVCDEWRYMCMSRPIKPMMPVNNGNKIMIDPLDMMKNRRR